MNLTSQQKLTLIKQLYELSTDTQVLPHLDEQTTSRISQIIKGMGQQQSLVESRQLSNNSAKSLGNKGLNKRKYNTEMYQINQINQQYEEKFAHLFSSDDDTQAHILKEINVELAKNMLQRPKQNSFKNLKCNTLTTTNLKPTKQTFSKLNKKQNIHSLASTHQKLLISKTTDEFLNLNRKRSKDKLISYKVQAEVHQMNETHSISRNTILKSKQKTPIKQTLNTNHSRSTLQSKSPIQSHIKRSQSQASKLIVNTNPNSLNSTSKYEKLPLLRPSHSKNSLSTSKLKSASKKSISVLESTATKRQLNSLPSIQIVQNHVKSKMLKEDNSSKLLSLTKSRSKEKKQQSIIKNAVKRVHTQCSVEKLSKENNFLEEMREEQNLNFDIEISSKKKQEHSNRRVVTQIFPQTQEHYESQFQQFQQEYHQISEEANNCEKTTSNMISPPLIKQQEQLKGGSLYLRKIMNEINMQREEKLRQKVNLQRQITEIKQKVAQQKRLLESTLTKNSKIQNQIQTLNTFHKSTINQRTLLERCINQTKKKTISLQQSIHKNDAIHKKLISEDLKEEQQLIEMYENVIDELRSEIKEQFKKKTEVKTKLELCSKKKDNKSAKFNSTLLSTQRIKHNLTDAFKEWV